MQELDVIIIGGGVLGSSLSYHLGNRAKSVLLLEREVLPAMHASGRNAGMMRALYRNPQLTEWAIKSIASWPKELSKNYFRQTGSLVVGREIPDHHPQVFTQRQHRTATGKILPAVFTATDGLLDSPAYVNHLLRLCDTSFVSKRLSTKVLDIERNGADWLVHCESGETFKTAQLVNAGGAWINQPLESHFSALQVDVKAYARHLLLVQDWPSKWMPCDDVGFYWDEDAGWYMRQWDADSRLVSICDQTPCIPERFVPAPDIAERTAVKLLDALPEIARELRIAHSWHCFRTYTEDQLPIIGQDPDCSGLYWFAAFGGFGMSTSFAAAADLAAILCGETLSVPQEFLPSRCRASHANALRQVV